LQILDVMDKETEQNQAIAWVWKDPRLPLVLPFWSNIWGDVTYVIPIRHPVETIFSAANMDGVSPDSVPLSAGFAYWQFCMLSILLFTENSHRKLFIAYDQLIQNPQHECTRLCHFLDKQCNMLPEGVSQRIAAMASRITVNQHHYQYPKSLADLKITTREQRALYNFLRLKAIYPEETFNKDDFALYPGWREYLQVTDMLISSGNTQDN